MRDLKSRQTQFAARPQRDVENPDLLITLRVLGRPQMKWRLRQQSSASPYDSYMFTK
jgi:hypothetical protein